MPLTVGEWIARSSTGDWCHPQRCEMGWFRLTFDFWFWFIFGKICFDPRTILVWEWDSFGRHRKNTCCVSFRATRPYAKDMIYTVSLTSKPLTSSTKKTVICYILLKMRFMIFFSPFKLCEFDNSFEGTVRLLTSIKGTKLSGFKQMQDIEESTANIEPLSFLGVVLGEKGYSKLSVQIFVVSLLAARVVLLCCGWFLLYFFHERGFFCSCRPISPNNRCILCASSGQPRAATIDAKKQRFGKDGWLW